MVALSTLASLSFMHYVNLPPKANRVCDSFLNALISTYEQNSSEPSICYQSCTYGMLV